VVENTNKQLERMSSGTPIFLPGPLTTSSGQHLQQPNRAPSTRREQTILVEVSSRDRNYMQRVTSNPTRFQFARPIKDVRRVELIAGTVPANPYNIVQGANQFTFKETVGSTTTTYQVVLIPGVYTATTLIAHLNYVFSTLSTVNTYSWSQGSSGGSVLAATAGTATFGLSFLSGSIPDVIDRSDGYFLQQMTPALQLGFDMSDYYDESLGVIASPFPMDLFTSMNRLYLYINLENSQDLGVIERGAGRRWPFAVIYLDEQTNGYKFLNKETLTPAAFSLPQPLSRMQNLQIEFRDEWYRLVDFNGKDFSLLLQFTVLE
jgi:hypothetical protein